MFGVSSRSGVRWVDFSLPPAIAGFSSLGCVLVGSIEWKGGAGRLLPRMACRARQLDSETNAPGLAGGGVKLAADL